MAEKIPWRNKCFAVPRSLHTCVGVTLNLVLLEKAIMQEKLQQAYVIVTFGMFDRFLCIVFNVVTLTNRAIGIRSTISIVYSDTVYINLWNNQWN